MTTQQQLDRIITIQQRSATRDAFGSEVVTWVDLASVWARFSPQSAREQFRNESNIEQASNTAAFRIRWRDDLDEAMRVVYDGHNWDIEGIIEVGRRDKLDLIATRN